MNKYIGKICPYCKTEIKESDEVVVCSVCDMPHHKDCWIDNQGCTTFGCTGTISTPKEHEADTSEDDFEIIIYDDDFPEPEQYQYCPKCGARNIVDSVYCCKCGLPISHRNSPVEPTNNQQYSTYNAGYATSGNGQQIQGSDIELLIATNTSYYTSKFNEMRQRGSKTSWNWSAFLIAPYWMIYRKMYGYGAAVLGGFLLLSLLGGWFSYLLVLAAYVVFGILGNHLYMDYIEKKAAQASMLSGQYKNEFVSKNGGTNIAAAILSAVGYAIIVTIIQFA